MIILSGIPKFAYQWGIWLIGLLSLGFAIYKNYGEVRRIYRWLQPALVKWPGPWLVPIWRNFRNVGVDYNVNLVIHWNGINDTIDRESIVNGLISLADPGIKIEHSATRNKVNLVIGSGHYVLRWFDLDRDLIELTLITVGRSTTTFRDFSKVVEFQSARIMKLLDFLENEFCGRKNIISSSVLLALTEFSDKKSTAFVELPVRPQDASKIRQVVAAPEVPSVEVVFFHPRDFSGAALWYLTPRWLAVGVPSAPPV